jgi:hypothetical protein
MVQKNRNVGLFGAIAIGIGGMVGGGIFAVLGEALSFAHGATALAFLVAGVVALLTSYSYAKLSVKFPNRGGTVVFVDKAFGHNLLSGSVNLLLWLSYLVTISLYAVAFASYGQTFFASNPPILKHLLLSFAILLPMLINLLSASLVSKSETFVVFIKLLLLALIIAAGASYLNYDRLSPAKWGSPFSIIAAGMIIFVAYEGFELIANSAEDIKNPVRNLPRAFFGSVILVVVLYLLISVLTVGAVPEADLMKAKDYALAVAAKPALGHFGFVLVSVAALLATFSAINASIYGNARLGFIIAKEGELPKKLDDEKHNIPVAGVIIITIISLLMANLIDLTEIAIIGSAGFLFIFTIVNFSGLKLASQIEANKFIALLAFLVSTAALVALFIHTYQTNVRAVLVFVAFIVFSLVFEFFYGRLVRGHFFHRDYKK